MSTEMKTTCEGSVGPRERATGATSDARQGLRLRYVAPGEDTAATTDR